MYVSDHGKGQHFIIPEMADSSLDMSELAKQAKKKLQQVLLTINLYIHVNQKKATIFHFFLNLRNNAKENCS